MKNLLGFPRLFLWCYAVLFLSCLSACGGGGGDETVKSSQTAPTILATSVAMAAQDVDPATTLSVTFSRPMNPSSFNGSTFTLYGSGNQMIRGNVQYSASTVSFVPDRPLPEGMQITAKLKQSVADLAGVTLTADFVWSFTTGRVQDLQPPTVISTVGPIGALGVAVNTKIAAFFSEKMDPQSLIGENFSVMAGNIPVAGTVSFSGTSIIFTPTSMLAENTKYTITIRGAVRDLVGNKLAGNQANYPANSDYVWRFTTDRFKDLALPFVKGTEPAYNAQGAAQNRAISVSFSEAIDAMSLQQSTFIVKQGSTPIAGTLSYAGTTVLFQPASALLPNTKYEVTVSKNVTDLAGNMLSGNLGFLTPSDYVWTFTTGQETDTLAPSISAVFPANAALDVALDQAVNIVFSESMSPISLSTANFRLMQGANSVAGMVNYFGTTASFLANDGLVAGAVYTVVLSKNVSDLAGNWLDVKSDVVWSFTTK